MSDAKHLDGLILSSKAKKENLVRLGKYINTRSNLPFIRIKSSSGIIRYDIQYFFRIIRGIRNVGFY